MYKIQREVVPEAILKNSLSDEYLFRELAREIVTKMPISELSKIFKFTKTDPNSKENIDKINDLKTPEYEKKYLINLNSKGVIIYEAESYI